MIEFAATVFVTFLVIIDPLGTVPLFVALTYRQPRENRRRVATRSTAIAAITLIVAAFAGRAVLHAMGIGLPAFRIAGFRIAGGLLLLLLSIDMVFARHSGIRSPTDTETEEAEASTDVAIFPIAIPLLAGPGALTSIILLMGRTDGQFLLQVTVIAMALLVLGLCLVTFLFAIPLMDRLGLTGINVIGRVFGIVLAALSVQYILDGLADVLDSFPILAHA
jgi:multiple antibiotic resistance protein